MCSTVPLLPWMLQCTAQIQCSSLIGKGALNGFLLVYFVQKVFLLLSFENKKDVKTLCLKQRSQKYFVKYGKCMAINIFIIGSALPSYISGGALF